MQLTQNLFMILLNQWLSIGGPQMGTISVTWEVAKISYLQATPQTYSGLGTLGERPAVQVFRRSLRCPTVCALSYSVVSDSLRPYNSTHQAPLSMGFSRQEYWNRLPCPLPEDLPHPGIKLASLKSPALVSSLPVLPPGKPSDAH